MKKILLFLPVLVAILFGGCIAPPREEVFTYGGEMVKLDFPGGEDTVSSEGEISTSDFWTVVAVEYGLASWYGEEFRGSETASGEIFDPEGYTAAHRTLPLNTFVKVTNLSNNRWVIVRINDRGPWNEMVTGEKGRIIDLSLAAARKIEMIGPGVVEVKLEVLAVSQ
jgi:rare lipoprotein A (peptidoglycan hydrolase)